MPPKPRVVFIPGFMGSRLRLNTLGHEAALRACRDNLDFLPSYWLRPCGEGRWYEPRMAICLDYPPCASFTDPATVWGSLDMIHWVLHPADWEAALSHGNGYDQSRDSLGALEVPKGRMGLLNIVVSGRAWLAVKTEPFNVTFDPYMDFLGRLRGFDVRMFPYDWRLSCTANAGKLAEQINQWWWPGHTPARVEAAERITIIGHSLGGLIGRYYLENEQLDGARYVRRLITVGTPHSGSPEAYTHFHGLTRPFEFPGPVRTFAQFETWLAQADGEHAPTHLMPLSMQQRLMRHYTSVLEMMPDYPFVCLYGGRDWYSCPKQALDITRRQLGYHRPTGKSAEKLIKDFRDGLVRPAQLDCFLEDRDIRYHFIAANSLETTVGYDQSTKKVIRMATGDGVVPGLSAALLPHGETAKHIEVRWLSKQDMESDEVQGVAINIDSDGAVIKPIMAPYEHQDLLRIERVQDYCIQQISTPPSQSARRSGPEPPTSIRAKWLLQQIKDLKAAQRRHVVSVIRLRIADAERQPILNYTLESRNGKTYARGLAFIKNEPIQEIDGQRFVYLDTEKASDYGGLLFLPARCADTVDLLTWNVGRNTPDTRYYCSNQTHAERQFIEWFEKQRYDKQGDDWRTRVRHIEITNRSTRRGVRGPSPCKECCRWLNGFLKDLSPKPEALISWLEPFVAKGGKNTPCGNLLDFTRSCGNEMKTAGWEFGTAPLPRR